MLLCEAEGALLPNTAVPIAVGNFYYWKRQNRTESENFSILIIMNDCVNDCSKTVH